MRVISKHDFGGLIKGRMYNAIEVDKGLYMVDLRDGSYMRARSVFFEKVW